MIVQLLMLVLAVQGAGQAPRPQIGIAVRPDTVTVGEPFRLVVRVRAAAGASIEFPTRLDSNRAVEALDPVVVVPSTDTTAVEQSATYRLAAWDVGSLPIAVPDVLVHDADGDHRLAVGRLSIVVKSVLPADSALRIPKPPRDVMDIPPPWWWWLVLAAAAVVVLLLLWAWWRRRRRVAVAVAVDPLTLADEAFDRVEKLGLVAAGERARHAALVIEVLRDYLARVVPAAPAALTTSELLVAIRDQTAVPANAMAALLIEADLVKFARKPLTADRALAMGQDARGMVHGIDSALHAPVAREAA
ncbi:MAG: hypothetical protein U0132_12015 [Gemmatimonadaceae bacterium]